MTAITFVVDNAPFHNVFTCADDAMRHAARSLWMDPYGSNWDTRPEVTCYVVVNGVQTQIEPGDIPASFSLDYAMTEIDELMHPTADDREDAELTAAELSTVPAEYLCSDGEEPCHGSWAIPDNDAEAVRCTAEQARQQAAEAEYYEALANDAYDAEIKRIDALEWFVRLVDHDSKVSLIPALNEADARAAASECDGCYISAQAVGMLPATLTPIDYAGSRKFERDCDEWADQAEAYAQARFEERYCKPVEIEPPF